MAKRSICFRLKNQEDNPKIKEGNLVGISIQTCHNLVWGKCGYLMVSDDQQAIQNLEKKRNQDHFFQLEAEIREEKFMEDVISDEGENLGKIGKTKFYVEEPNWGENIKVIYYGMFEFFIPTKVIKNEKNLLHIEIEPMELVTGGMLDNLIFKGANINQYRDLIAKNLGKEFKMPREILGWNKWNNTNLTETKHWKQSAKIELVNKEKENKPEKSISELRKILNAYYKKNNINCIKRDGDKWNIIYNDGSTRNADDLTDRHDKQKLEQVKIYLKSNNKNILSASELNASSKNNLSRNDSHKADGVVIILAVIAIAFLVAIVLFIIKQKNRKQNKLK